MGIFSKKEPVTKVEVVPVEPFDPNADQWKCCCRQLHIITGAKIVAIMYVVIVTIHIITASINFSKIGGLYTALFSKALVNFVFCVIGVAFLMYALRTSKRMFIIPMLLYQIIFAVVMIIFIALMIKALSRSGKYLWELSHLVGRATVVSGDSGTTQNTMDQESKLVVTVLLGIILLLVCVFALLMDIRYFLVIYILFKFYRAKDNYEKVRQDPTPLKDANSTAIVMLDDNNSYERKPPQYNEVSV